MTYTKKSVALTDSIDQRSHIQYKKYEERDFDEG